MNATVVDDVRRLLSGTSPLSNSAEVEEALANSRSNNFAKEEDIKLEEWPLFWNNAGLLPQPEILESLATNMPTLEEQEEEHIPEHPDGEDEDFERVLKEHEYTFYDETENPIFVKYMR